MKAHADLLPLGEQPTELSKTLTTPESEIAEMQARLAAAERKRDGITEFLRAAEEERDGVPLGEAEALRGQLDAPTLRGVLEQAKQYFSLLAVTADPDEAKRLEHHQKAPHWRKRLAAALATIQAYAETKNLARAHGRGAGPGLANLKAYCDSHPFPLLSPAKVILSEGNFASRSPRGKADRKLRIPEVIHPSGRVVMLEHIRIGDGAPPAPRLHYLDDTNQSGLVVVGFFGEHLTNASTN
ncbi:hypothetical protein [Streptomyces sp. NPDC047061]|uniref:hypothetical protein n=1 Tax=Streptomyces sp. NPDC047061 TaxID=3154605 RepID=UPI0033D95797